MVFFRRSKSDDCEINSSRMLVKKTSKIQKNHTLELPCWKKEPRRKYSLRRLIFPKRFVKSKLGVSPNLIRLPEMTVLPSSSSFCDSSSHNISLICNNNQCRKNKCENISEEETFEIILGRPPLTSNQNFSLSKSSSFVSLQDCHATKTVQKKISPTKSIEATAESTIDCNIEWKSLFASLLPDYKNSMNGLTELSSKSVNDFTELSYRGVDGLTDYLFPDLSIDSKNKTSKSSTYKGEKLPLRVIETEELVGKDKGVVDGPVDTFDEKECINDITIVSPMRAVNTASNNNECSREQISIDKGCKLRLLNNMKDTSIIRHKSSKKKIVFNDSIRSHKLKNEHLEHIDNRVSTKDDVKENPSSPVIIEDIHYEYENTKVKKNILFNEDVGRSSSTNRCEDPLWTEFTDDQEFFQEDSKNNDNFSYNIACENDEVFIKVEKKKIPEEEKYNIPFTLRFIRELTEKGLILIYFQDISRDEIDGAGITDMDAFFVNMFIRPGTVHESTLIEPQLAWKEMKSFDNDEAYINNKESKSVDLLSIHSIHTSLENVTEKKAKQKNQENTLTESPFFIIMTSVGDAHVFEARTLSERNHVVHGLKNVIAWLSRHLILGSMASGLVSSGLVLNPDEEKGEESGELPNLKLPLQAMNDLCQKLLD